MPGSVNTFLGQEIPAMDSPALRQFGLIFGAILCVLFGVILPFLFGYQWPVWPWIAATVFALVALVFPRGLDPVYQVWMRFGVIMNIIMSRLILGTVFLLTVVPAGLIFKLRGKDILDVKLDKSAASYRRNADPDIKNDLNKPY